MVWVIKVLSFSAMNLTGAWGSSLTLMVSSTITQSLDGKTQDPEIVSQRPESMSQRPEHVTASREQLTTPRDHLKETRRYRSCEMLSGSHTFSIYDPKKKIISVDQEARRLSCEASFARQLINMNSLFTYTFSFLNMESRNEGNV